jgi:hypothetical protein
LVFGVWWLVVGGWRLALDVGGTANCQLATHNGELSTVNFLVNRQLATATQRNTDMAKQTETRELVEAAVLADGLPEARIEVGRDARRRNLPTANKPARRPRKYVVRCELRSRDDRGRAVSREFVETVEATGEREAWAVFCDTFKRWPDPHLGTVDEA